MRPRRSRGFRPSCARWLAANLTDDLRRERSRGTCPRPSASRGCGAGRRRSPPTAGWRSPGRREYGGRDASIAEQIAYVEEMTRADAPGDHQQPRHRHRRTADPRLRHRGAEAAASRRASSAPRISGAAASRSPAPARTSRRCAPRRCSTATSSSSTGRRCGRPTRSTPTGAWCSAAPIRSRAAATASPACSST